MEDKHLTSEELAERLGVPCETISYWRKIRSGPTFLKVGRHVRYRLADVVAWEKSRAVKPGA